MTTAYWIRVYTKPLEFDLCINSSSKVEFDGWATSSDSLFFFSLLRWRRSVIPPSLSFCGCCIWIWRGLFWWRFQQPVKKEDRMLTHLTHWNHSNYSNLIKDLCDEEPWRMKNLMCYKCDQCYHLHTILFIQLFNIQITGTGHSKNWYFIKKLEPFCLSLLVKTISQYYSEFGKYGF